MIQYRAHNGYDVKAASDEATLDPKFYGESLTIQSQTEDSDINVIVRRMTQNGQMPLTASRVPEYGDYMGATDYRSALHIIMDSQDNFMSLPPTVRAKFDNDPQLFLDFCANPANIDELAKMGLARDGYKVKGDDNVGNGRTGAAAGDAAKAAGTGAGGDKGAAGGGS